MYLLAEPFTRDLVFFGVLDTLIACFGLYGITKIFFIKKKHHYQYGSLFVLISLILLLVSTKLALIMTAR